MKISRVGGRWSQRQREATEAPPKPSQKLPRLKQTKPDKRGTVLATRIMVDTCITTEVLRSADIETIWKQELRAAKAEHRAAGLVDGKPNKQTWIARWLEEHGFDRS